MTKLIFVHLKNLNTENFTTKFKFSSHFPHNIHQNPANLQLLHSIEIHEKFSLKSHKVSLTQPLAIKAHKRKIDTRRIKQTKNSKFKNQMRGKTFFIDPFRLPKLHTRLNYFSVMEIFCPLDFDNWKPFGVLARKVKENPI